MGTKRLRGLIRYFLVALPLLVAVLPHLDFSPIWDGVVYANCIVQSVAEGLDLWALNCSHHPSVAGLLPAAVAFKFSGGTIWSLHVANLLLALGGIWAFLGILDTLFPEASRAERALAAACLAAIPVMSASVLHTNTDLGTFVFSVVLLFSLLREQRWLAGIASVALPLTKEIGIGLWLIIVGSYALAAIIWHGGASREKVRKLCSLWPVLFAPMAFWWYAAGRFARGLSLLKPPREEATSIFVSEALSFSVADPVLQSYLASMFILNFSWILTGTIMSGLLVWAARWALRAPSEGRKIRGELIVLLFVAIPILMTRFRTFSNVRYFLPMFPITMLAAFLAMRSLLPWKHVRVLSLIVVLFLFQISTFRTVDPVSKRVYGSFMFGKNPMLNMTSITGECCGRGRDQLVYNTEFTLFDTLTNKLIADLKPNKSLPLVIPRNANFLFLVGLVGTSPPKRVAIRLAGAQPAPVFVEQQLGNIPRDQAPQQIIWLDLPNIDGEEEFKRILASYSVVEKKTYEQWGYQLSAKIMARR